jgi:hypothetical protein
MFALAALCLIAGILPGFFIDALAPAAKSMVGASMPLQRAVPYLSIVPIAEARSSYNGLLVFLFMLFSAGAAVLVIHRFASNALRRGPAWDCGYPDPSPATQYTSSSFAQPIRRVFGTVVFRAKEEVVMPSPGDMAPARLAVRLSDTVWDTFYAPIARVVEVVSGWLNPMQYLSIRHYLGLVLVALVGLLLVLTIWP